MDFYRNVLRRGCRESLSKALKKLCVDGAFKNISTRIAHRSSSVSAVLSLVIVAGLGLWTSQAAQRAWLVHHRPSWNFWESYLRGHGMIEVQHRVLLARNLPSLTPDPAAIHVHRDGQGKVSAILGFHPEVGAKVMAFDSGEDAWRAPKDWVEMSNDWRTVHVIGQEVWAEPKPVAKSVKTRRAMPDVIDFRDPDELRY